MRLIKRYSNRKLYDTETRTYITLERVAALVVEGTEIKVVDNDTNEDLTTVILSQLLLERERAGRSLSSGLLSGLVRSSETLGRNLSGLTRPLQGGLVGLLEHEIERSFKFWLEFGQGSEEEVLRLLEGLIEKRRKARQTPETNRPASPGLAFLRRRNLDDFESWDTPDRPADSLPVVQTLLAQGQTLTVYQLQLPLDSRIALQSQPYEQVIWVVSGKLGLLLNQQSVKVGPGESSLLPANSLYELWPIEETHLLIVASLPQL